MGVDGIVVDFLKLIIVFFCFLVLQTPESKKEEFKKYLDKSGAIESLTKGKSSVRCMFKKG